MALARPEKSRCAIHLERCRLAGAQPNQVKQISQPVTSLMAGEMIDSAELASRWKVQPTWVRKHTTGADDRIPHIKLGRYVRYVWGSPELSAWLEKRYCR